MDTKLKVNSKIIFSTFFTSLILLVYGCSPSGILATGGGTAMVVAEGDRTLGTVVDDATIKIKISKRWK